MKTNFWTEPEPDVRICPWRYDGNLNPARHDGARHLDEGPAPVARMTRGQRGRAGFFTKAELQSVWPVARWNAEDVASFAPIRS